MASLTHVTFSRVASFVLFASLAITPFVRADDLTGMAQDDPKDLYPAPQTSSAPVYNNSGFLPMPSWARGVVLPPLPDVLKPMGKQTVLTTPPVPAPLSPPPPKVGTPATVTVAKPTVVTPAPSPALIAVSPFLDWIKANPQAAAEQARQQAGAYQAVGDANAAASTGTTTAPNVVPANGNNAPVVAPAPYWMPPLIDTATFGTGTTTGSSAAIYSTPQR